VKARRLPIGSAAETRTFINEVVQCGMSEDCDEMFRTFNMGVGLMVILPQDQTDRAVEILRGHRVRTLIVGEPRPRGTARDTVGFR
jgi:phosphoribosylaminoimidazole (AIR) synthetase